MIKTKTIVFIILISSLFNCTNKYSKSKDLVKLEKKFYYYSKNNDTIVFKDIVNDIKWDKVKFIASNYESTPFVSDGIDLRRFKGFLEDYSMDEYVCYAVFYDKSKITGFAELSLVSFQGFDYNINRGRYITNKFPIFNKKNSVFFKKIKDSIQTGKNTIERVEPYSIWSLAPPAGASENK